MYVVPPPKGSSDTGSNGVGSGDLRVYQTWKGSNIFFLQGRFIFGPDVRSLALTIFLIVAPVALFCIFVARKLMDDFSDDWGISIMAVAVMFTIYVSSLSHSLSLLCAQPTHTPLPLSLQAHFGGFYMFNFPAIENNSLNNVFVDPVGVRVTTYTSVACDMNVNYVALSSKISFECHDWIIPYPYCSWMCCYYPPYYCDVAFSDSSATTDAFQTMHHTVLTCVALVMHDLVLLLLTSGRDPGIIPRNAHPPEPEGFDGSADVGSGQTPQLHHLAARIVQYAITVSKDLTITALGLGNALAWKIMGSENISTWKAMIKTPSSIVLIVYTFISMWFVGGLTAFHLYLISTNQTTYENFRYRYDRRANPFYKGLVENFKEIFCSSIPPSKNNFRATVPREPTLPTRTLGGGFMSPNMGKAVGDIEMGRKTVWGDMSALADGEGQLANNDRLNIKDGELGELSPDIRTTVDEAGDRVGLHPRRSSWGRKSGSWEMSPEVLALAARVGESNRAGGGSSLTTENQQS
ncbi:hypothetical protein SADUNF_Sadunf16G0203100 [Salix dunnii]|uniref:protein S-acyltransferase n=1 Tax=Salix dunnii TaxID=1413687 RepID=A0A835MJK1_9ROSI|nr:hypothetical protein SADUNF_Sadunf16G0203100 [Salix dunnii]